MNATRLETATATVYCVGSHKMALYGKHNANAWLSTTQAIDLRKHA